MSTLRRTRSVVVLLPLCAALATGCEQPGDPPSPESTPGNPAPVPEAGMTTGRTEEVIDMPQTPAIEDTTRVPGT